MATAARWHASLISVPLWNRTSPVCAARSTIARMGEIRGKARHCYPSARKAPAEAERGGARRRNAPGDWTLGYNASSLSDRRQARLYA